MLLCFGLRLTKFPGKGFQWLVSHWKGFRSRLRLECISYRKADLIRCYHHPHPPQAVPPLPEGEGSLSWRITSLAEGEKSLGQSLQTPWERVLSGRMDSATSPSAPRRMTGVGGILRRVKVFVLKKPGIKKSVAMRISYWCTTHWLLILCALMLMLSALMLI